METKDGDDGRSDVTLMMECLLQVVISRHGTGLETELEGALLFDGD